MLNKENLVELSNRYHNNSVNYGLKSEFSPSLKRKNESELPDFKNRMKQSDIITSYVSESRSLKKRRSVMNNPDSVNNLKLNERLSRKVSINLNANLNSNTQRIQPSEYGYLSGNEYKSPHKLKRVNLSTQKVEEYLTNKDIKFKTPNNLSNRMSFDRESEIASTKESNQFQSMKKISLSIDRLKAKAKLLGMNHLSAPTENRDYSIGLKALDPLDKFDIPTTPKLSVSK